MSYTGARDYTIGIAKDKDGNVECDPTFFLIATSGLYRGEIPLILQDDLSTNWIGYIAIGPYVDDKAKRDIVVAFRGTQVPQSHCSVIISLSCLIRLTPESLCPAAMRAACAGRVPFRLSRSAALSSQLLPRTINGAGAAVEQIQGLLSAHGENSTSPPFLSCRAAPHTCFHVRARC